MTPLEQQRKDLLASFSGRGFGGFVQYLAAGGLLAPIESEADRILHNDRLAVILSMVGVEERQGQHEALLRAFATDVVTLAAQVDSQEGTRNE